VSLAFVACGGFGAGGAIGTGGAIGAGGDLGTCGIPGLTEAAAGEGAETAGAMLFKSLALKGVLQNGHSF
jgi:hypothetical protein